MFFALSKHYRYRGRSSDVIGVFEVGMMAEGVVAIGVGAIIYVLALFFQIYFLDL
jgi:hypothetical protein